jgi:hypothetical protein
VIVNHQRVPDEVRQRALFRDVNERIREINEGFACDGAPDRFEILCECGVVDCVERLEVSVSEYKEIRRGERNFVVMAGHEGTGLDHVLTARPSYRVVEIVSTDGASAAPVARSNGGRFRSNGTQG